MSFIASKYSLYLPLTYVMALAFLPTLASTVTHITGLYFAGLALRIIIQLVLPVAVTTVLYRMTIRNAFFTPLTPFPRKIRWTEYTGFVLSLGAVILIFAAYYIFYSFIDFTAIRESLMAGNRVTASTYPFIALSVALINPFLEEYFWRGFIYRYGAKFAPNHTVRVAFLWITGILFAIHHTIIIYGWFVWWQWILVTLFLALVGVLFNWLFEKSGNILVGLMIHTAADIALAFLGLVVFGAVKL